MNNLVSIIIPLYNAANYIESCLTSVVKQTYTNLQVIIVNDGSTDDSLTIVIQFIRDDSRFTLVNQENKGCSAAKNKGLQYATGDFIQYLDADDILSENKIEEANQWIAMWEDILHDIEVLTMIKRNTSVVEILIEDIYLN
jgi:glycosyltransferase involved in cell wall biosynthesis